MGTEEFWVPAVIAAVSSGAEAANQSAANSRANNVAVQNLQQQQQLRSQAAGNVSKVIQQTQQTPQATQALAGQQLTDYTNQLRNAAATAQSGVNGAPTTGAPAQPGANPQYAKDLATGNAQVGAYGSTLANQMAQVGATIKGQQALSNNAQNAATNISLLNQQSAQDNFVNQLREQAAGQANPWVALGSQLGTNAAGALASSGALKSNPAVNTGYDSGGYGGFTQAGTPIAAGGTDSSGYINSLKGLYGSPSAGVYG